MRLAFALKFAICSAGPTLVAKTKRLLDVKKKLSASAWLDEFMIQSPEDCASVVAINFVPFFGNEISSKKSEWDFGYSMQCTSILNHHSSNRDLPASRFRFWLDVKNMVGRIHDSKP